MSPFRLKAPLLVLALLNLHLACDSRSPGAKGAPAAPGTPAPAPKLAPLAKPEITLDQPVVTALTEDHWAQINGEPGWTYDWVLEGGRITGGWSANVVRFMAGEPGRVLLQCRVLDASGREATATAEQTVVALPWLGAFTALPPILTLGGRTNLQWESNGMASLRLEPGDQEVAQSGGSLQVQPTRTTTYVLTGTNAAGSVVEKTVLVKVVPPPVIKSFGVDGTATVGQPLTLKAEFSGGKAELRLGAAVLAAATEGPLRVQVNPTVTTTYSLLVTNEAGAAATLTLTVTNPPLGK